MIGLKIEAVNLESILPLYKVSNNKVSNLIDISFDKITSTTEIYINSLENQDDLIDLSVDEYNNEFCDLIEGYEGDEKLFIHKVKERNYSFMKKCKELYAQKDKYLHCEICNFSFYERYGEIGLNFIEGHHIYPIAELTEETKMKSTDIIMICSNCHKMIHRQYPCLTQDNLREIILHPPL